MNYVDSDTDTDDSDLDSEDREIRRRNRQDKYETQAEIAEDLSWRSLNERYQYAVQLTRRRGWRRDDRRFIRRLKDAQAERKMFGIEIKKRQKTFHDFQVALLQSEKRLPREAILQIRTEIFKDYD